MIPDPPHAPLKEPHHHRCTSVGRGGEAVLRGKALFPQPWGLLPNMDGPAPQHCHAGPSARQVGVGRAHFPKGRDVVASDF